jgi:hypothetical protein
MRSMFTSTFQPARRAALHGYRPALARQAPPSMGVMVMANERNAMLQTIATGEERTTKVEKLCRADDL